MEGHRWFRKKYLNFYFEDKSLMGLEQHERE